MPIDEDDIVEGDDGFSGEEEETDDADEEDDVEEPPAPEQSDEDRPALVAYVARRQMNTVDIKPGGYAWFSA